MSHPPVRRSQHQPWSVDLESATAVHREGWVFRFSPADDDPGAFIGQCISQPKHLTPAQLNNAAGIAREAGDAFIRARRMRH